MASTMLAAVTVGTLLICGGPEVLTVRVQFEGDTATVLSRTDWRADRSEGMPASMVPAFKTTDDCKPIDGGARVLITSSSGGVAIVDRASGRTLFYTTVPNAHSAEALPGDRIVVAASTHADGNRLMVFDRASSGAAPAGPSGSAGPSGPATAVFATPLESAHGVAWIEAETTLWALGLTELRAYDLVDWSSRTPSLKLRESFPLPSKGGHDLSRLPGSSSFIVTTETQALTFDRRTHRFAAYAPLAGLLDVKSVNVDPASGRIVYTVADKPEWWTHTVRFLNGAATLAFPDDRLYKTRWLLP